MNRRAHLLRRLHAGTRHLFGDDEALRHAWQLQQVGKASCGEMDEAELMRLIQALEREQALVPPSSTPQARLIHHLWDELDRRGALHHHTEPALEHFVRHQTGLELPPEGLDHKQANQVIEALKAWLARVQEPGG
jgi:hypothetical protein